NFMSDHSISYRDIAMVFAGAFICGLVAWRLRQPILIGYVLAGLILSPLTPGPHVHDVGIFETMAEIGVILLMFSVGIEFSIPELLKVKMGRAPRRATRHLALCRYRCRSWFAFRLAAASGHRRRLHHFCRQHHGHDAPAAGPRRTFLRIRSRHGHVDPRGRSCRRNPHDSSSEPQLP